jgi:hypothetical protein
MQMLASGMVMKGEQIHVDLDPADLLLIMRAPFGGGGSA